MTWAPFLAPNRDDALKEGRARFGSTTEYTIPGVQPSQVTTIAVLANRDYYIGFWQTDTPIVVDRIASEVTAGAGTNFRMGFYRADLSWQPVGAPLMDSGNLDAAGTGVKTYTPGTPVYVPRGRYLSVVNADGGPTFRMIAGGPTSILDSISGSPFNRILYVARTYAAFPTPGTAWDTNLNSTTPMLHAVFYRVSAP